MPHSSVVTLFTFLARRLNITVIVLTQNIFAPAKHSLTLKRNTQYFIIFHTQFSSIIKNLSSELYGSKILIDAMKQLCSIEPDPHKRYLLLDLHPKSELPEPMVSYTSILNDLSLKLLVLQRIRGKFLEIEENQLFFVPKDM